MKQKAGSIGSHIFLIFMACTALLPFGILIVNSFREDSEIKLNPLALPQKFILSNYINAWNVAKYGQGYFNSLIVGVVVTVAICLIGGMLAFAVTKLELPGTGLLIGYFLVAMAVPTQMYLVPVFYMFQKAGLVNNLIGISIIYIATYLPFSIMLLRSFFLSIPKEIDEAAMVDGCNSFQVFSNITLPLAKPAFLTVILIVGVWTWNEFMFSNIFLNMDALKTVATKYVAFTSEHNSNLAYIYAGGIISILPIIAIYLLSQRKFIEGMTSGGVKG